MRRSSVCREAVTNSRNNALAEHIRLRAPQDHGQTLQVPPIRESNGIVDANRILLASYPQELQSIRSVANGELGAMAQRYSRQYMDVDVEIVDRVVMAGHQPTLFHPGVWFKNFALDAVASTSDATAINLVVDNDLCADVSVLRPRNENGVAKLLRVPFDAAGVAMPFEMRQVIDREIFDSFADRLSNSIKEVVASPLVNSLWPEVLVAAKRLRLPASIAAGRHRLEQKHGLKSLELPISVMSTSESFAMFVLRLVTDAARFNEVHNEALGEYRKANRIRSRSHPVPELETDGRLSEIPFWIWTTDAPNRRRLFVNADDEEIELTDRVGWSMTLSQKDFVASFQELNQLDSNVFIRPRALATTMFSRLFAGDVFLHGIGGAKYDQLNDEIMQRFFAIDPPAFMTMTATMKLPFDFENVTKQNLTQLGVEMRQLRFHSERQLANNAASRKRVLIANPPTSGSRKAWRDEIAALNETLFESLQVQRQELEEEIARVKVALPTSKILGSREFNFALFPESLIEELQTMSTES